MYNSEIDKVTINESDNTSTIYDDKNINSFNNLNIEATLINEFIKEQILDTEGGEVYPSSYPNPFIEEDENDENVEHAGYVYRLWNLEGTKILVRSQVHAYSTVYDEEKNEEEEESEENEDKEESEEKGESEEEKGKKIKYDFIDIFALNEFDKNNYLAKESNLGASIIKKELKNNYIKMAKWGILSYLGGVKKLKIAFLIQFR